MCISWLTRLRCENVSCVGVFDAFDSIDLSIVLLVRPSSAWVGYQVAGIVPGNSFTDHLLLLLLLLNNFLVESCYLCHNIMLPILLESTQNFTGPTESICQSFPQQCVPTYKSESSQWAAHTYWCVGRGEPSNCSEAS